MQLMQQVQDIIAEEVGIPVSRLTETTRFTDDLGLDSLDKIEIIMAIEKEFDIDIDDQDAEKLSTVGSVVDYLESRLRA